MIDQPRRGTRVSWSAASDVYKRQVCVCVRVCVCACVRVCVCQLREMYEAQTNWETYHGENAAEMRALV